MHPSSTHQGDVESAAQLRQKKKRLRHKKEDAFVATLHWADIYPRHLDSSIPKSYVKMTHIVVMTVYVSIENLHNFMIWSLFTHYCSKRFQIFACLVIFGQKKHVYLKLQMIRNYTGLNDW